MTRFQNGIGSSVSDGLSVAFAENVTDSLPVK